MNTNYLHDITNYKSGESSGIFRILFLLLFTFSPVLLHCQSASPNLEIFYQLADSAANNLNKNIPAGRHGIKIDFTSGNSLSVFDNRILESLHRSGRNINLNQAQDTASVKVSFNIDNTSVEYGDLFQQKLFGDFYTQRKITLGGNYILFLPGFSSHNFKFTYTDTVNMNEIRDMETGAFPFTQGKIPPEPLFSSIYEPIIAVGAAAITVILFFTIRSK